MTMKWIYRICAIAVIAYIAGNLRIDRRSDGSIKSISLDMLSTSEI
jgi:hypothetical protein